MKKLVSLLLALGAALSGTSLAAENDSRFFAGGSGLWIDNEFEEAFGGSVRVGWTLANDNPYGITTDFELEAAYWEIDQRVYLGPVGYASEVESLPLLVNLRVHFPLPDLPLRLYAGGGVGVSLMDVKGKDPAVSNLNDESSVFTWALVVGLSGQLSDNLSVHGGYRYLVQKGDTYGVGATTVTQDEVENGILEIGINVHF